MAMTTEAIEALSEEELCASVSERGVDVADYPTKQHLIDRAQMP